MVGIIPKVLIQPFVFSNIWNNSWQSKTFFALSFSHFWYFYKSFFPADNVATAINIPMAVVKTASECGNSGNFSIGEKPKFNRNSRLSQTQSYFDYLGTSNILQSVEVEVDTGNWNLCGHTVDVPFSFNLYP